MAIDTFVRKIERALEGLVTLQIVTAVGEAIVDPSPTGAGKIKLAENKAKLISTSIDLVQGDITTVIHPDLQGEGGQALRDFHKEREAQGMAIIQGNIAALKDLVAVLGEAYRQQRASRPDGAPNELGTR